MMLEKSIKFPFQTYESDNVWNVTFVGCCYSSGCAQKNRHNWSIERKHNLMHDKNSTGRDSNYR